MAEFILKNVRLSFPELWEARSFPGNAAAKPRFDANFLIEADSDNHDAVEAAITQAAAEAWGAKAPAMLAKMRPDKMKFCYADGDAKVDGDGEAIDSLAGQFILSSHRYESQGRPVVVDENLQPLLPRDGKPRSGSYVNAKVEIWIQQGQFPGVRCSFSTIQFVKHGDSLGGGRIPDTVGLDVIETDEHSAAGLV